MQFVTFCVAVIIATSATRL